jgi:hypothetical protein
MVSKLPKFQLSLLGKELSLHSLWKTWVLHFTVIRILMNIFLKLCHLACLA